MVQMNWCTKQRVIDVVNEAEVDFFSIKPEIVYLFRDLCAG